MDLREAFSTLGLDISGALVKMSLMDYMGKKKASEMMLYEAKRKAKLLMAKYHPDRGGDSEKFKEVNSSIMFIEKATELFLKKCDEKQKERDAARSSKVFIQVD